MRFINHTCKMKTFDLRALCFLYVDGTVIFLLTCETLFSYSSFVLNF